MFADTLNEEQATALAMVQQSRVSVLCGAPGVGKTYTCRAVLEWATFSGLSVALAAPTGKAAKRLSELTEFPASTIHRLLGPIKDRDGFRFEAGPENPLPYDLLILDETSMVDTWLMHSVMVAVDPDRTRVLLVGDPDQLPSIGPGTVLQDIITSGVVPVARLTQIQRNAGDIVRACHAIKAGQGYEPSEALDLPVGRNLRHIEVAEDAIPGVIESLVAERLPARGYDPLWGVQVISPTNEKGSFSCGALNRILRERLNQKTGWTPPENPDEKPTANGNSFRAGDKVIQTKNELLMSPETGEEYVVNGDMGVIENVGAKSLLVKLNTPDRLVTIPLKDHHLLLAYAITCHRAQGSEFPVTIIPVSRAFGRFVDRCWIYTALSRAREICITVGEFSAIQGAIGRVSALRRRTGLTRAMVNEYARNLEI